MRFRRLLILCSLCLSTQTLCAQELRDTLMQSIPVGSATPGRLSLSLKDALDLAIKSNLAAVYSTEAERLAVAHKQQDLAALLPKLEAKVRTEQRQVNLAAFGFGGFPGVHQVIGPFALVDARASFTQSLVDTERRHNLRESMENERATTLSSMNTRELVVLMATDLYFQVVSAESRVTAVEAQLDKAKVLLARANDLKNAGVAPGIDVVRAEVAQRSLEQRLIQAKNEVQKEKLSFAKSIGLTLSQEFVLTDRLPVEAALDLSIPPLLQRAFANRSDAKALDAQVSAAEEAVKAVQSRNRPTLSAQGDYGAIGRTPFNSHGTYSLSLEARMPVFDKKNESDILEKESNLRKRQAERDSLKSRIEFDVRTSVLDIQSALDRLQVAHRTQALTRQQLDQAQDRFSAGVTDNLEVVQAQEAVALADEEAIQSLYTFNISAALLARATGTAERSIREAFNGSSSR